MSDKKEEIFEDLFSNHLKIIQGVEFTRRQIDVVACVVSGWDVKSIAARLDIAPSTVESHIQAIVQKVGAGGRNSILSFVEQSGKEHLVRQHYQQLVVQIKFEKELKEIARLQKETKISCHIHYDSANVKPNSESIKRLKRHFELSGIQIVESSSNFSPDFYVVIIASDTSEFSNPVQQKAGMKTIFLSLAPKISFKNIPKSDCCFALGDFENYYLFVLKLLDTLFPESNISEAFDKFKTQSVVETPVLIEQKTERRPGIIKGWPLKVVATSIILLGVSSLGFLSLKDLFLKKHDHSFNAFANSSSSEKEQSDSTLAWNLPFLPTPYVKRPALQYALWSQFAGKNKSKSTKIVGLVGLGGIGKTFLAMYAIHHPKQPYKFRAWLNAETESLLKTNYFEIGHKFNLFSDNMSDAQKTREVKTWLENKGSVLLVYDNAPSMDILYNYLPNNAHIIVTSRNHKIKNAIEVDVMTKEEAFALLKAQLPTNYHQEANSEQNAAKLLNELHYTPLAISQAAGYITENAISISNYLKLYETEQNNLLSDRNTPLNVKHDPIYATWDLSLNAIEKITDGDKARDLLNFISFCYPANIPKSLLVYYVCENNDNKSELELNRLLSILRQYSLIKTSGNDISIHRLVSSWLRDKLDQEQKLVYLKKMRIAIEKIYPRKTESNDISNREDHLINQIIPQLEVFLKENSLTSDETQVSLYALTYRILNEPHKAEHILEEALKINESLYGENHPTNLQILNLLGSVYHHLGESVKERDGLRKVVSISEKTYGKEHPKTARAFFRYALAYMLLGDFRKVRNLLSQVLRLYQKHYGDNHLETARVLYMLGWVDYVLGERVKGKKTLEHALQIHSQNPTSISCLAYNQILLGFIHYDLDHLQKSEIYFRNALKIRRKLHGGSHIWTALSTVNLALACAAMHRTSESKRLLNEASRFIEKDPSKANAWVSILIARIGIVHSILGDYLQSKKMLMNAIENLKKKYGDDYIMTAIVSANLGNVYRLLGNVQNPRKLLRQSLKIIQQTYGDNHPTTAMAMANLALTLENTEKKKLLEKSLEVFKNFYSPQHPNIRRIVLELENKKDTSNVNELKKSLNPGYYILLPL